ncbi:hypothetical protein DQK91_23290, partial [Oceanidesulfovibrio marinus]
MMTLAATLAIRQVARTVSTNGAVFMHGPTLMRNPLACVVSNACPDLLEQSHWQPKVHAMDTRLKEALLPCRHRPGVNDLRIRGAIEVVEMSDSVSVPLLQKVFIKNNIWLRHVGKLIYTMPPYIISREEVANIREVVA